MQAACTPADSLGGVNLAVEIYRYAVKGETAGFIFLYVIRSFFYPKGAMWYLLASIVGAWILAEIYCRFQVRWKKIWLLYASAGYLVVLLCNNYYFLIENHALGTLAWVYTKCFVSARNGVFLAPVFMGMGFLLREEKTQTWLQGHKGIPVATLCVGTAALLIEAYFLYPLSSLDDRGFFLSQLIYIPSLVSVALLYDIKLKLPYTLLRRLSTSIFFLHSAVIKLLGFIVDFHGNNVIRCLTVVGCVIIIALLSYRSENDKVHAVMG